MSRPSARAACGARTWAGGLRPLAFLVLLSPAVASAAEPRPAPTSPRRGVATAPAKTPVAPPAAAPAAPVEPLAEARARAQKAGRALVLEFGAEWCGPCREFERRVLPLPEVKQSLAQVVFVRYDGDEPTGHAAAKSLGVVGFPTFVALAQDGSEIGRLQGYQDAASFTHWIGEVAPDSEPTEALVARVAAQPGDARALLLLGQRRLRQGDEAQAVQLLERAAGTSSATAPPAQGEVVARADWLLRLTRLRQVLRTAPRQAMAEHLLRFPLGSSADEAFKALARIGPADALARKALGRYIDAHKDAAHAELLNLAVYECLRAGALDEAERAARFLLSLDGKSPLYHDTLAEVLHLRGEREAALKESALALALVPSSAADTESRRMRAALLANQARFSRGQRELPSELKGEPDELFPWERDEIRRPPPAASPSGR
ncbi:MAG: thioredoxin family protein [Polyangia bacterium]